MKYGLLSRKVHYWATLLVAVPVLIVCSTGVLLQVKKHVSWVQPPEQRGTGPAPRIDLKDIVAALRADPGLGVAGWGDIDRIDVRPGRAMAKVLLQSGWEAQVDLGTGRVLQKAYRRSDLIESIHDGSFLAGDITKLGLFMPAGVALFLMVLTGLWMFWQPIGARRRRRARPALGGSPRE